MAEIESYQKIIDGARQVVENYKPRIDIDPEWEMVELREIGKIMTGGTPSKDKPEYWQGNIPWVSPKDMKSDYILDSIDHISQDAIKESSTKLVPNGYNYFVLYDWVFYSIAFLLLLPNRRSVTIRILFLSNAKLPRLMHIFSFII